MNPARGPAAVLLVLLALLLAMAGCAREPVVREPVAASAQPLPERRPPPVKPRSLDGQLRADAPLRYVVKRGDTLWDIAGYYLRDPWYWPELWYANPEIDNPHLIYPGEVLVLTRDAQGRPVLRRANVERLSPRVREESLDAIATIPLDSIRAFLTGPRLVSAETVAEAPYVVSFIDEHLVGGQGQVTYIRRPNEGRYETDEYSLVRITGPYEDPDTGDILGQEAVPVGQIRITDFDRVSTGVITSSYRESLVGDRLLKIRDEELVNDFHPHLPNQPVAGRIISVFDGVTAVGQFQVVTLSVGRDDGIERGHVLDIYEAGQVVQDPVAGEQVQLPEVQSGSLMVFKTDARVSFAVVMRAERAIQVRDFVRSPAA